MRRAAAAMLLLLIPLSTNAAAQQDRGCRAIAALTGSDGANLRDVSIRVHRDGVRLHHRATAMPLPAAANCDFDFTSDFGVTLECRWRPSPGGPSSAEQFDAVEGVLRRCLGPALSAPVDPAETRQIADEGAYDVIRTSQAALPSRFDDAIEVRLQQAQHGVSTLAGAVVSLSIFVPTTNGQ